MTQPSPPGPLATYGEPRPGGRRALVLVVALVAAVGIAWLVWAALHHASATVPVTPLGYTVVDEGHVQVRYQVDRDPARAVQCTLEAQGDRHDPVGRLSVVIPAGGDSTVVRQDVVRTTSRAVVGLVDSCQPVQTR